MKGPARSLMHDHMTLKALILLEVSILMIKPLFGATPITKEYQDGDFINIFVKPFSDNDPNAFNLFFQGFVATGPKPSTVPDMLSVALLTKPGSPGAGTFYTFDIALPSNNAQFNVLQKSGSLVVAPTVLFGGEPGDTITVSANIQWTCNNIENFGSCQSTHVVSPLS